ncbi:2-isopropylmalate synthase [Methanopyrus sp. KOL6]|uniref:2-isopropylmalate synthase n=1 Tax=Methanopyrus sp. KOL6 TaxID=1937004 RepID=UPI000B4BFB1D|nr:2-isopropylmalate synthase [Methanopyrus sp. KOL6]
MREANVDVDLPDEVRIFDTTLRDGEQTPGVALTPEEKLRIARKLDEIGVDTIEAGFAAASEGELKAIRRIVREELDAEVCSMARMVKGDVDAAIEAEADAVHIVVPTSEVHVKKKLRMDREEVLERASEIVEYAHDHGLTVEISTEDGTRTELEYLYEVFDACLEAGAERLGYNDTVGVMAPEGMFLAVKKLRERVGEDVVLSVHCHDDFGMATANTVAAVRAGARQVHVTVNGIGERAGNAALEEVVVVLEELYGVDTGIRTERLTELSKLVERLTGVRVPPNKAVVGENAFTHESGIHADGILKDESTYEPIPPEKVGHERRFVLGKHVGTSVIRKKLKQMGIEVDDEQLLEILRRLKRLGDRGKRTTEADLRAIAEDVLGRPAERDIEVEDFTTVTGKKTIPTASIVVKIDGTRKEAASTGVGPVDATIKALERALRDQGIDFELVEYRAEALTGGTDAITHVDVKLRDPETGEIVHSGSSREDIVVASLEAFIDGINALIARKRS